MKYQARSGFVLLAASLTLLAGPGLAAADAPGGLPATAELPGALPGLDEDDASAGFDDPGAGQQDIAQSRRRGRSGRSRSRDRDRRRARARRQSRRGGDDSPRRERAERSRARSYDRDYDDRDYDDRDYDDRYDGRDDRLREERATRAEQEREAREERRRSRRERLEREERYWEGHRPPPMVDVLVGGRVEGRLARFETTDGNVHRNDVAYPVITALVTGRPFADATGLEQGLTIRGSFGYAVGLRSRNTLTDEAVDTSFFHLYLDAAMLFEVVPTASIGLGIGVGFDSYAFGEQALIIVPSAEYSYLRPHLQGRFLIEDEMAVFSLDLGYRLVLARGALSEHFGQEGQTQGFDIVGRLGGNLDIGLSYGLEAGITGYFHFFDGDALTTPAESGTDFGLWLGAQIGFAIR